MNIMEKLPPKALVKTWLELAKSDEVLPLRKTLIEQNIEKIFGSIELAEMYKDNVVVE